MAWTSRGRCLGILLIAAGAVPGCEYQPVGTFERPEYRAQAAQGRYGVKFVPGTAELAPGETERLALFLRGLGSRDWDEVLLTPGESGSPALDQERLAAASEVTAEAGIPVRLRAVDSRTRALVDPGPNAVLVEALSAGQLLVLCPSPYLDAREAVYAGPTPSMTCSNAANLAHMAAEPGDLLRPRSLGPTDGTTAAAAVLRYRTDAVKDPGQVRTAGGS